MVPFPSLLPQSSGSAHERIAPRLVATTAQVRTGRPIPSGTDDRFLSSVGLPYSAETRQATKGDGLSHPAAMLPHVYRYDYAGGLSSSPIGGQCVGVVLHRVDRSEEH